ncbi:ribosome biogenesis protein [Grosmannia clavigera kw1407]|uniref:Ribosome biogenesis protein n=1 Tax=Grosmannia clavigera (strain kw1407 / UAMH 11150) TaxID=655863 RepID=F0XIV3_GROCL|nr:ribosome biogenesis protein [Grosmannia clavigera kw1407]EFX02133.1 ribosome biogenesis protein [Grosmannia clavigera kw1407]
MARRRSKRRTHAAPTSGNNGSIPASTGIASARNPKSMVIRIGAGEVGSSVSQLASDVRRVMEPGTASRLKERRANRLRDYVTMCGPLGVTQLLLFSRSTSGNVNLRISSAPRGPTLHFRVEKYSLSKDVQRAQKHPKGGGKEYINPPLLVMNNFSIAEDSNAKIPKHLESLITTSFQSLFPPINPQATPLTSIRRVLLLNRERNSSDPDSFVLNFRHYAITTKATGISKALKRLNAAEKLLYSKKTKKGGLPNLGKLQDISDYMVGGENGEGYVTDGGTSGSEAETDAEVEVLETTARKVTSTKSRATTATSDGQDDSDDGRADVADDHVERRAVKLIELGPRMRLRLIKVEEGLCQGQVMWHEHIHKSQTEIKDMKARWETRRREKEARKKEQKDNVEKKKANATNERGGRKTRDADKDGSGDNESDEHGEMDVDDAYDSDGYESFDSEGLEGDAEMQANEIMEDAGDWEDEKEEIAGR